jgi:hypothetical protein
MFAASCSSGLSLRSGTRWETIRRRFVSITSTAWQHGHWSSTSLFSFAMDVF